jgi:Xaa-Pro aminopeptidase
MWGASRRRAAFLRRDAELNSRNYYEASVRRDALTGKDIISRPARILRAGMVLTIEPGIYVRAAAGVPEHFHGIGIRIEDDAIVTAGGCELISRGVPVAVDEIEALMRG